MLKSISIGNFKAFGATQRVPIGPLTLIFGPNSAGKSSLIHSLLFFHNAEAKSQFREVVEDYSGRGYVTTTPNLDVHQTILGGNTVDLGGWRSYVHKQGRQAPETRMTFGVELDLRHESTDYELSHLARPDFLSSADADFAHIETLLKKCSTIGLQSTFGRGLPTNPSADGSHGAHCVQTMEVTVDGIWLLRIRRKFLYNPSQENDSFVFDDVNLRHPFLKSTKTTKKQWRVIKRLKADYECLVSFLPEAIQHQTFAHGQPGDPCGQVVIALRLAARTLCRSMRYLSGIRILPPRFLTSCDQNDPNYYASGMDAWDRLVRDDELLELVNRSLRTLEVPVSLAVRATADISGLQQAASRRDRASTTPASTLRRLRNALRATERSALQELYLVDGRSGTAVSHRDVGIGTSQILPVLALAEGCGRSLIMIEQPEVHVHPQLQAHLADVFIDSALGERKNTFLIETHSEHLILRILRRVRETTEGKLESGKTAVRPEDVSVVFVEPTAKGSVVRHLPVTPDGDFGAPWPGGFFAERFQDLP